MRRGLSSVSLACATSFWMNLQAQRGAMPTVRNWYESAFFFEKSHIVEACRVEKGASSDLLLELIRSPEKNVDIHGPAWDLYIQVRDSSLRVKNRYIPFVKAVHSANSNSYWGDCHEMEPNWDLKVFFKRRTKKEIICVLFVYSIPYKVVYRRPNEGHH